MVNDNENYYSLLGCEENASVEVIRKCYHEKALTHHPDKGASEAEETVNFDKITKAWKALSDPETRRIYDAKLSQERFSGQCIVFGTFARKDLTFDKSNNTYTQICRCGGLFVIDGNDIMQFSDCDISVECDTCSLVINIS